jgi:hypothetical protein
MQKTYLEETAGFEVLTAMAMKSSVFQDISLCNVFTSALHSNK